MSYETLVESDTMIDGDGGKGATATNTHDEELDFLTQALKRLQVEENSSTKADVDFKKSTTLSAAEPYDSRKHLTSVNRIRVITVAAGKSSYGIKSDGLSTYSQKLINSMNPDAVALMIIRDSVSLKLDKTGKYSVYGRIECTTDLVLYYSDS